MTFSFFQFQRFVLELFVYWGICPGVVCPGGICPRGVPVQGVSVQGGILPVVSVGGYKSGRLCPRTKCLV